MRKINLKSYEVDINGKKLPYEMRPSLKNLILGEHNQHTAQSLLENADIGKKITASTGDDILLEEGDYQKILKSVNLFKGYQEPDEEMIRRVLNAEVVEVTEKPKTA
jgi:hypothetical protein